MAAIVIDGKVIAEKHRDEIRLRVETLKKRGVTPCLAVVLVGEDPSSVSYVKGKQKAIAGVGMEGRDIRLSASISEEELLAQIAALNADSKVHGILVQLPLPSHIREELIINSMDPGKDVDCFHPVSIGKILWGQKGFIPCTPYGVAVLLKELEIPVSGREAVVIGRSNIVGKPLAMLLARRDFNATVTLCHTGTVGLASHTRRADILIAAAGQPALIKGDMIKKGAAVIDVGVNWTPNSDGQGGRLIGDVVFEEALETAGWITPVPGGVGPMTITMLLRNVLEAAEGKE